MDTLPFKGSDLLSFGGLALIIPMMIGGLKKLWPTWIAGKEPHLVFALTYVLGIASKLAAPDLAFGGQRGPMGWLVILVGLFFTALGAMAVHDNFVNKVLTSKGDDSPPK